MEQTGAKRNPDKITAIAAYFEKHLGATRFTRDEVKAEFPRAGEVVPSNFGRDFRWAVTNKWLGQDHQDDNLFYITSTGKSAVSAKFPEDAVKATRQKPPRKRAPRKKTTDQE